MTKPRSTSNCPVTQGEVDVAYYENLDGAWRILGIPAPARRALVDAKLLKINDLRKATLEDVKKLHGMGPKAIGILVASGAKFKQ